MNLYAATARRAHGRLLGGGQGREIAVQADRWMQNQEIVNPERVAAMLAPGLSPRPYRN
jgi:hypothetical protein